MRFDIITIFPEMFAGVFSGGVVKRALDREVVRIVVHDLRDFTTDKHRQVDDRPFGGLEGMVLKPEPIFRAVEAVREDGGEQGLPALAPGPDPGRRAGPRARLGAARSSSSAAATRAWTSGSPSTSSTARSRSATTSCRAGSWPPPSSSTRPRASCPASSARKARCGTTPSAGGILDYPQYTRPREFRGLKVPAGPLLGRSQEDRALAAEEGPGKNGPAEAGPGRA